VLGPTTLPVNGQRSIVAHNERRRKASAVMLRFVRHASVFTGERAGHAFDLSGVGATQTFNSLILRPEETKQPKDCAFDSDWLYTDCS
jgi:hypothetical protein